MHVAIASADPTESLALARLGCQHEDGAELGPLLDVIDALLELAHRQYHAAPDERFAIIPAVATAICLAATPDVAVPRAGV